MHLRSHITFRRIKKSIEQHLIAVNFAVSNVLKATSALKFKGYDVRAPPHTHTH
jgi:hypothetical protein